MDRPLLRPLEAFPVEQNGQRLLALRDPSGLTEAVAALPPVAVAILQLCDGQTTRDEICEEFLRRYGSRLTREALDRLLAQLDDAMLLDSQRFRDHSASVFAAFKRQPMRGAHLAGRSYPADVVELRALLDGFFAPPHGPGRPEPRTRPLPRAIIAPHIDFQRGSSAYAWAYRPLGDARDTPELIIVFGTDHQGSDQPFTLTRKHYDTPLGHLETDVGLVDELVRRLGGDEALFEDEHHHRSEHSIEFQMVWLRHMLALHDATDVARVRVLPILCGSLHEFVARSENPSRSAHIAGLLEAVRELSRDRRTLWIAGADLAHVGPRFGDSAAIDEPGRSTLEARDQATLAAATRGDAAAWFEEIRAEQDCRRVCGLPPIYALLTAARPGAGHLRAYAQCAADDEGGSLVSIASVVYG